MIHDLHGWLFARDETRPRRRGPRRRQRRPSGCVCARGGDDDGRASSAPPLTHLGDRAPGPRERRLDKPDAVQQAQEKGDHEVQGDAHAKEADHAPGDLL